MQFKKTKTSILRDREAARKSLENHNLLIQKVVQGSTDPRKFDNSLKNNLIISKLKETHQIAMKHSIVLTTLEKAKFAKFAALKKNQKIVNEVKIQQKQSRRILKHERDQQTQKFKQTVHKIHLQRLKVRKTRFELSMEKKLTATEVKKLKAKHQSDLTSAKEKERQRKRQMVQNVKLEEKLPELKIKTSKSNDLDKFSVLELEVSIANLLKKFELEKEEQWRKIRQEREHQKQLLNSAENFIKLQRQQRDMHVKM
jgi:hypothetical protein